MSAEDGAEGTKLVPTARNSVRGSSRARSREASQDVPSDYQLLHVRRVVLLLREIATDVRSPPRDSRERRVNTLRDLRGQLFK